MPCNDPGNSEFSLPPMREIEPGEEIVISGIAGRFPDSDNVKEFRDNLFNKVDMVTADTRRWDLEDPDIPKRLGKVNNLEKFDALFFGVHTKQVNAMDPMCRIIIEHAFEAVLDAGVNPRTLRRKRVGVFVGTCHSESEKSWFYNKNEVNGFGLTGCSRAMLANRISYSLDVTGPSFISDTACSSSLYALDNAYRAIREGLCDSALVGGANLCLHPYVSMQFYRLGVLSKDGACKAFDNDADGYARAETISVIFLQKAKDAKRVYLKVAHALTNCDGFKEEGVTFPSSHMQSILLEDFYKQCGIPPTLVDYIEAHGTGTKVGDPEEVNAIDKVFCPGRKTPLKIGSGKSNHGHSEPASGMCCIAKVIIASETGKIPPNIHYKKPKEGIKALEEGRIKVVTEATPWKGGYVGINSFGFGGANAHILVKTHTKEKVNNGIPEDDLPRLVAVSSRTEEGVATILDDLSSRPVDSEYIALYHNIHADDISGHLYRGYTLLPAHGTSEQNVRKIESYPGSKRPVWFVFSGMGSQWPGMGKALLRIPVFNKAIQKCDNALKPKGLDIYKIITNDEKTAFDNILNSFVGIAAVQIGLVDVLFSLDIRPDNIIGHSVGELGCAYADGCFTAEQMILAAYSRGMASLETKVIRGSMAAVGMGYKDLKDLCPPDIQVACHNSSESATISGPADSMKAFVAELTAKNIFAREVPCSNIPYHSRYIADAGPRLLAYLNKVIPNPKQRSEKWFSTSVPMEKWDTPAAQYSSAEYHTNNLLSSVLFEETSALIPKDAITIEIAPHGLLQAIIRRSLDPSVSNLALTQRGHADNVQVFLQAIGNMYNLGMHPKIANLYPKVEFPVSRGTPMIAPLIRWEHSTDWFVTSFKDKIDSCQRDVEVTLDTDEFEFVGGHVIDGRTLFPATGYLYLTWETLALIRGEIFSDFSVVFEDVKFLRATTVSKQGSVLLVIMIHKGTGRFEINEGDTAVVTGQIRVTSDPTSEKLGAPVIPVAEEELMTTRDVYKELRLRGYHYSGLFRSVKSSTVDGSEGRILWHNNWVAFMDNMLQMQILGVDSRGLFVPTGISKLVIDPKAHMNALKEYDFKELPVTVKKLFKTIESGGIEIRNLKANAIARRKPAGEPVLEEYKFVPHLDGANISLRELVRLATHICLENYMDVKLKTLELFEDNNNITELDENSLSSLMSESFGDLPLIQPDISIITSSQLKTESLPANVSVTTPKSVDVNTNALLAIGGCLLEKERSQQLDLLLTAVQDNGFLLTRERSNLNKNMEEYANSKGLEIIMIKKSDNSTFVLLRKKGPPPQKVTLIRVTNNQFNWIEEMRDKLSKELENTKKDLTRIIFVGQEGFENGLMGLVNCLRRELGGEVVRGVLIQDPKAPEFSLQNPFYSKQLQKDLAVNVLRENGVWGTYRHLPLSELQQKPVRHAFVNQLSRGDLSSLTWIEGPIRSEKKDKNLVEIHYSSLNFKDVMLATGKLAVETSAQTRQDQDCVIGFEYSGVDSAGKRLMGMVQYRALSNLCIADNDLSWEIPDRWSLEDGATVPCVYGTCYYALYQRGKMKKGDKVLIHAGTGGIGQAAINLALHEGCEIFTTVGTPEKFKFIREHFPQIPENHIGNSRDTSFEKMIIQQTNGRGVDIVLNSLAEEKLLTSVKCLAWGGRFLEIGKFDLSNNNSLGMEPFLKEISFQGVMLDHLFTTSGPEKIELKRLLCEGLKNGAVKPLVRTIFPKDQVEAAFRYMAGGKHIGKVLIQVQNKNEISKTTLALPRFYCLEDRSYIILGGLGGFGLELADWLVLRGAKNIVLTSRSGVKNGYQKMRIQLWQSYGVRVRIIINKDASNREDCEQILKTAINLAPIDGIFNLAVVLKDALWDNQTQESFKESFRSKAWATKQLDVLTRTMCPSLRHFVVFSSVSCGRGNAGQTNYGMSNSIMERVCERRVAEGLPGLAIQWGAVGDVGLVADMQEDNKELVIGGTLQQSITSCLQELDGFLSQKKSVVASMVVAEKRIKKAGGASLNVVESILNIMGLKDLKGISPNSSLAEIGMDSMMGVEIKQTLEREFEIFLTAQEIRSLNFAKLQEMDAALLKGETSETNQTQEDTGAQLLVRLLGIKNINDDIIVKLNTKTDSGKDEIFFIPGLEGFSSVFSVLAPKINAPALCLQPGLDDRTQSSFSDTADLFLPLILNKKSKSGLYTLVGYSTGAAIAIELTRKLEAKGLNVQLIFIDGAPHYLKTAAERAFASPKNQSEFIDRLCYGIMSAISPKNLSELSDNLKKCKNTLEDKLEAVVDLWPSTEINIPKKTQRNLVTCIYKRALALANQDLSKISRIKSPITLIKPSTPMYQPTDENYNLTQVTSGLVKVHTVDGDHATVLENEKVAAIINGELVKKTN